MSTVWLYNTATPLWTFSTSQYLPAMLSTATPYWMFTVGSFEL